MTDRDKLFKARRLAQSMYRPNSDGYHPKIERGFSVAGFIVWMCVICVSLYLAYTLLLPTTTPEPEPEAIKATINIRAFPTAAIK